MRGFLYTLLLLTVLSITLPSQFHDRNFLAHNISKDRDIVEETMPAHAGLHMLAKTMKAYAKRHHYNQTVFFIANMSIASGKKRFFVYDAIGDSVLASGLVTHGQGQDRRFKTYSNVVGSYCTSPGMYKVGVGYIGKFGQAFKLHGLDSSNSNAFSRNIVLHAHECVPDIEVFPERICLSQGCPTVSPAFLRIVNTHINSSKKPIMLNILP